MQPCQGCGRTGHPRRSCPAASQTCYSCGIKGHLAVVCRRRHQVPDTSEEQQSPNRHRRQHHASVSSPDAATTPAPSDRQINAIACRERRPRPPHQASLWPGTVEEQTLRPSCSRVIFRGRFSRPARRRSRTTGSVPAATCSPEAKLTGETSARQARQLQLPAGSSAGGRCSGPGLA